MEVYEGPQLTPPRISLLSAAEIVPMEGERWISGFDLILEGCDGTRVYAVCPPEDSEPKDFTASGSTGSYKPYVLYATDKCSTWPAQREFYDRAQRKLLAGEAKALEEQLWTGQVGGVDIIDPNPDGINPTLAGSAEAISFSDEDLGAAFSQLEQAMAECSGSRGMIHVRPVLLASLLDSNHIRREGNVYVTPLDNIVVPGRGYPGTGPTGQAVGNTEWIYGHPGIVQVRRGPVIRLGEDDQASQYERYTNDRQVIVERVVHVALDPSCCVYAAEVPSPGPVSIAE